MLRSLSLSRRLFLRRFNNNNPISKLSTSPLSNYASAAGGVEGVAAAASSGAGKGGNGGGKNRWGLFMYGAVAAVMGVLGSAGYTTYAYSLEEVDEMTKGFRSTPKPTIENDAGALEKLKALVYSSAITVPIKSIEVYLGLRKIIEAQVKEYTEPPNEKLLPDVHPQEVGIFTLVLDLNETLLYTDWTRERGWRTFKRPGVEQFLAHLAQFYEIIVFSDQPSNMYVDPVCERLDPERRIRFRLGRNETKYQNGKHYKDLSKLNRDPAKIIYVSAHALESTLQPENSVSIKPWKGEAEDTTLIDLMTFLEYVATNRVADIRPVIATYEGRDITSEFLERSKEFHRKQLEASKRTGLFRR